MAKKEEIFVGLDIGSFKITTVVGKTDEEGELNIIGVGTSFNTGVRKGIVNEIEETVSGISESMETAERMAGVQLDSATININGSHISSFNSKGVVAVGKANQEVTYEDTIRVDEAAQAVQIPTNKEILHVIPRVYSVDGQEGVKDPIGMTGIRLEGEVQIVTVSEPAAKNLKKCVSQAGIQVEDIIASPLAASKAVTSKREKELGCVVIDIGSSTTGLIVYEDERPLYVSVLPVGSAHITNDIAIGLRTSIDVAEKVKLKYGTSLHKTVPEREKIDLSEIDMNEEGIIPRRHVAEIIEARLSEIFTLIKNELRKINRDGQLPAGAVLTGGGAKLEDIDQVAKNILKLPCVIGKPHNLKGMVDKIYDPRFSTAVGLMLYQLEETEHTGGSKQVGLAFSKIKKVFKTFMP
ncbi:MAG: cell division protein FtsA [bacterium]|nr:cell division protein FtsA [bacterium]